MLGKDLAPLVPVCEKCHKKVEFRLGEKRWLSDVQRTFDVAARKFAKRKAKIAAFHAERSGGICAVCKSTLSKKYPCKNCARNALIFPPGTPGPSKMEIQVKVTVDVTSIDTERHPNKGGR